MKRIVGIVVAPFLAVLITWWFSVNLVSIFADRLPLTSLSKLGSVGDTFGVVTSLFSGLGAIGIVAVIAIEQRSRRLTQQPFLTLDSIKAVVVLADFDEATAHLELKLTCEVNNATPDPCLNPVITIKPPKGMSSRSDLSNRPIVAGEGSDYRLDLSAAGPDAALAFQQLSQNQTIKVDLSLTYGSLNGTQWRTTAVLTIGPNDGDDMARFRKIGEKEEAEYVNKSSLGRKITLEVQYENNSWKHSELLLPTRRPRLRTAKPL